jgi:predicted HD superfamily hydrolase involved in NAD metabolism
MRVMGDLSEVYDLDTAQAMTAGLLHDAARDLPLDDLLALAREARIAFSHPAEAHPIYLHAPVGAYLVKKDAGISDPSVLRAIAAHSHVDPADDSDGMLTQCLRAADVLAPISDWKGMARLKSLAYAGRMEEAALLHAGWLVEHFQNEGIPVHPHLHDTVRRLSAKLGPTEAFFERW